VAKGLYGAMARVEKRPARPIGSPPTDEQRKTEDIDISFPVKITSGAAKISGSEAFLDLGLSIQIPIQNLLQSLGALLDISKSADPAEVLPKDGNLPDEPNDDRPRSAWKPHELAEVNFNTAGEADAAWQKLQSSDSELPVTFNGSLCFIEVNGFAVNVQRPSMDSCLFLLQWNPDAGSATASSHLSIVEAFRNMVTGPATEARSQETDEVGQSSAREPEAAQDDPEALMLDIFKALEDGPLTLAALSCPSFKARYLALHDLKKIDTGVPHRTTYPRWLRSLPGISMEVDSKGHPQAESLVQLRPLIDEVPLKLTRRRKPKRKGERKRAKLRMTM